MRVLAFVAALAGTFLLLQLLAILVTVAEEAEGDSPAITLLFALTVLTLVIGIPAAYLVAILRYRLWDLDVVIRKAVVFGVLAGFISIVYAGIVAGLGALVGSRFDTTLAFAAAAVLALLFQPVRERARRLADRFVYGKRATPYEVLSEFSNRVGESYAADDVLPRMAQIVAQGTGADAATVWLRVGAELRPEASWPGVRDRAPVRVVGDDLPDLGEDAVEVRHLAELLGAISLSMPPNDPMNPSKERLVRDLASQAGLVLRNARLIQELRASRQRLVAAQDEERRRIERNLHDGAQQQLVALSVQLRLAEQMTGRDPDKERELLQGLQAAANQALDDLRDLARGIYPPLLADQGLPAALEAQARKSTLPVELDSDGLGRYPQDVEAAVYFCALEALQNIAKYAEPGRVRIALSESNGQLRFEVEDDGRGFDVSTASGSGLVNMRDRLDALVGSLEVRSEPGRGTTVSGRIPVVEAR